MKITSIFEPTIRNARKISDETLINTFLQAIAQHNKSLIIQFLGSSQIFICEKIKIHGSHIQYIGLHPENAHTHLKKNQPFTVETESINGYRLYWSHPTEKIKEIKPLDYRKKPLLLLYNQQRNNPRTKLIHPEIKAQTTHPLIYLTITDISRDGCKTMHNGNILSSLKSIQNTSLSFSLEGQPIQLSATICHANYDHDSDSTSIGWMFDKENPEKTHLDQFLLSTQKHS